MTKQIKLVQQDQTLESVICCFIRCIAWGAAGTVEERRRAFVGWLDAAFVVDGWLKKHPSREQSVELSSALFEGTQYRKTNCCVRPGQIASFRRVSLSR